MSSTVSVIISLGRVRTRRQSSGSSVGGGASVTDSRGRSRAKVVSQSQREFTVRHTRGSVYSLEIMLCHHSYEKKS